MSCSGLVKQAICVIFVLACVATWATADSEITFSDRRTCYECELASAAGEGSGVDPDTIRFRNGCVGVNHEGEQVVDGPCLKIQELLLREIGIDTPPSGPPHYELTDDGLCIECQSVSYTHLTLPTNREV